MSRGLEAQGLTLTYGQSDDLAPVVFNVSLTAEPNTLTGLVGESGCGKSTLGRAMVGWLGAARRASGDVLLEGEPLYTRSLAERRRLWGRMLSYIPQSAGESLHPTRRVGALFEEALRTYGYPRSERRERALSALSAVEIRNPEEALRRRSFQFSGGQKQRLALALAMVGEPRMIVFDEPTTGVDVTVQAQITALLQRLVSQGQIAGLYISHDMGLVSELTTHLAVMYAGQIVETGKTEDVLSQPRHPYTAALIKAIPRRDGRPVTGIPGLPPARAIVERCSFAERCPLVVPACLGAPVELRPASPGHLARCIRSEDVCPAEQGMTIVEAHRNGVPRLVSTRLRVRDLVCEYSSGTGQTVRAVENVSLHLEQHEVVGLVGESGSGKSTILRAITGLTVPVSGTIELDGRALPSRARERDLAALRSIQLVFQDPDSSLNPRRTAGAAITAALRRLRPDLGRPERASEVARLFELVRLDPSLARRYPHELSGGQKQRVAIARALSARPTVLLCDEIVSALDVSVQAELLNTLRAIKDEQGCSILFVSHDLGVVRLISDRVYVLRDGVVRESGTTERVLVTPDDAYTRELISAIPGRF